MLRKLRIIAACFFFALSVAVLMLWIRSYSSMGIAKVQISAAQHYVMISWRGRITLTCTTSALEDYPGGTKKLSFIPAEEFTIATQRKDGWIIYVSNSSPRVFARQPGSFHFKILNQRWDLQFPHWFLCLLLPALALFVKPKPRMAVSLSELLFTVTVVCLMLGGIEGCSG